MTHESFALCTRNIRQNSLPYRLYQKAKKFGIWNPKDIDLSQDALDWQTLTPDQQSQTIGLLSNFQAGEEAVTLDLLPLMMMIAKEGRIEEEMFLTTFLFEEAKHTEFFNLVLNTIGVNHSELSAYHSDVYKKIFYEILPETMDRLLVDQTPEALADASTVYNMFIEGVLAETGYFAFYEGLDRLGKMPGLMQGVGYLKTDESRHIGYGTFLLQRLICEHPHLIDRILTKLNELAPLSLALSEESNETNGVNAFGVPFAEITRFTENRLHARIEVLKRAVGKSIDEIYQTSEDAVGVIETV